jgi:catechol 2,3-dioxygenase-like lactoylglutathione lyase family enzyme
MLRNSSVVCSVVWIALAAAVCAFARTPPPPNVVVGIGGFSHIVANVERSVQFYRDVIGLEMPNPPRPLASIPWIMDMGNTPGAQSRPALLHIPGSALGVELIDYKDIDRKAAHPRFQDPGAASLILTVRDLDAVMAKLKAAHARIMSQAGEAITVRGRTGRSTRLVSVQDPDGFFVQIGQPEPMPATTAPESSNIIGGSFEIVVADMKETLRIYNGVLGFQVRQRLRWAEAKHLAEGVTDVQGAEYRFNIGTIPGTSVPMSFIEFKHIDRKPLDTRVQDPGTAILQVGVRDIDATVAALKAAGVTVISKNGEPVNNGNARFCMVRDPNNLFLELFQRGARRQ